MADNKSIVRDYLDQMWTKHNVAAIDTFVAPDFVQHAHVAPPGRDGLKIFVAAINAAFSDMHYDVGDMLAEEDKVCWRWELRATHSGAFQGIPATGKSIRLTGISIVRLANGQFAE